MQRWQRRKWRRKVFCLWPSSLSKTSAGNSGRPAQIKKYEGHDDYQDDDVNDAVIAYDGIEGERPSPQGLGPQWEAGASGKVESFVCPPSLAEYLLTFLKAEDSLAFLKAES